MFSETYVYKQSERSQDKNQVMCSNIGKEDSTVVHIGLVSKIQQTNTQQVCLCDKKGYQGGLAKSH